MDEQRIDYIKSIENAAAFVCRGTGLFPSVMIAQGCLESNNGKSVLSAKYHNHFGIKVGSSWTGATVLMSTGEEDSKGNKYTVKTKFRAYPDIIAGFKNRVHLLQNMGVYARAGVFTSKTAEDQCQALFKAGYATDHLYPEKLIQIIDLYNLKQYDSKLV